jgi:ankyrin repeat protein
MYAIKAENTEGVKLLLSTSIDLKHKDKSSLNALDYAMDSKNEGIIKLIKDKIKE